MTIFDTPNCTDMPDKYRAWTDEADKQHVIVANWVALGSTDPFCDI